MKKKPDKVSEPGDIRAEAFHNARRGNVRILDHIVQQGGTKRRDVQFHVRQDVRDFQRMRKIRVARLAELCAVLFGGKFERPA